MAIFRGFDGSKKQILCEFCNNSCDISCNTACNNDCNSYRKFPLYFPPISPARKNFLRRNEQNMHNVCYNRNHQLRYSLNNKRNLYFARRIAPTSGPAFFFHIRFLDRKHKFWVEKTGEQEHRRLRGDRL